MHIQLWEPGVMYIQLWEPGIMYIQLWEPGIMYIQLWETAPRATFWAERLYQFSTKALSIT